MDRDLDRRWLPVTIIVTAWNREGSVAAAIDSALGQTVPEVDVIVVDDGSTDGTPAVLARYASEPRVRTIRHAQNRGVTAAKNSGLAALEERAAAFCFLDSDDTLLPGAIEALVAGFEAPRGPWSQVLGWCRDTRTGDATGSIERHEGLVTYEDALCGRFSGDFLHLARRDLLDGHRFEERGSGGEASLWWRLLREAPARLIPDVVANVDRGGADRVSVVTYSAESAARRMFAYQAVVDAVGVDMRRECRRQFGQLNADISKWAALAGDRPRARRAARHALRDAPGLRSLAMTGLWLVPAGLLRSAAAWRSGRRVEVAVAADEVTA
jgi:glycosyltransferase involved in cell wall biosynthesis